jgi:hypothetical protein
MEQYRKKNEKKKCCCVETKKKKTFISHTKNTIYVVKKQILLDPMVVI